jgi:hypothetical protein
MKTNVLVFQSNILDVLLSRAAITVPSCFSVERHHSQGAEEDARDRLRQADGRRAAEAGVEVKPRRLVMLHERAGALRGLLERP